MGRRRAGQNGKDETILRLLDERTAPIGALPVPLVANVSSADERQHASSVSRSFRLRHQFKVSRVSCSSLTTRHLKSASALFITGRLSVSELRTHGLHSAPQAS